MTPLRRKMLDAMAVSGFAALAGDLRGGTGADDALLQAQSGRVVGRGDRGLHAVPGEAAQAVLLRRHQLAAASRFLFTHVLGKPEHGEQALPPVARTPQRRPELLACEQLA